MKKEKERMIRRRTFILLLAGLVAACLSGVVILFHYNNPVNTARAYFDAILEKDWDAVYQMVDIAGDGQFLEKSAYITVVEEQFRDMTEYSLEKADGNTYVVEYDTRDGLEHSTIVLVEQEPKFLLFQDYKVQPVDLIAEKIYFLVPDDISIALNGIPIEAEYIVDSIEASDVEAENDSVETASYEKIYCLPSMYIGKYVLELSGESYQEYTEEITIHKAGEIIRPELPYLAEETVAAVSESAFEFALQEISSLGADLTEDSTYIDPMVSGRSVTIQSYGYNEEGNLAIELSVAELWSATKVTRTLDPYTDIYYFAYEPESQEHSYDLTYSYEDAKWVLSDSK